MPGMGGWTNHPGRAGAVHAQTLCIGCCSDEARDSPRCHNLFTRRSAVL
jgi:hypothetical protein